MTNPFNLTGYNKPSPNLDKPEQPNLRIDCTRWMFGCEIYKKKGDCVGCNEYTPFHDHGSEETKK